MTAAEYEELPVVTVLRGLVAELRNAATAPLPSLDVQPEDEAEARELITKAAAWATVLKDAGRELGDWFTGHSLGVAEQWTGRDLLGALPPHLDGVGAGTSFAQGVTDFVRQAARGDVDAEVAAVCRADIVRQWPRVASNIRWATLAVRSRAVQLCAWVETQLAAFYDAALPDITVVKNPKREDRWTANVSLAGVPMKSKRLGPDRHAELVELNNGNPVVFRHRSDYTRGLPFLKNLLIDDALTDAETKRWNKNKRKLKLIPAMVGRIKFD